MSLSKRLVIGAMLYDERGLTRVAQKAGRDGHCSAGIEDVNYRLTIMRRDFDGRMRPAGGCAANEQWQLEALTLHLSGYMDHLVERRRDQPAESDQVHFFHLGAFEDLFARDHHPHVDHFVVIAGEHNPDNILADVVHVALDGRE